MSDYKSYTGKPTLNFTKDPDKEKRIKKEIARLKKVFKDLDENKLTTVQSLIQNVAYMAVTLSELQDIINQQGFITEYQNGKHQFGTKQSAEVEIYINLTKNHTTAIKQLIDLVPKEKRKESKLETLRRE